MDGKQLLGLYSERAYRKALAQFSVLTGETEREVRSRIDAWRDSMSAEVSETPFDEQRAVLQAEEKDLAAGNAPLGSVLEDLDLIKDYQPRLEIDRLYVAALARGADHDVLVEVRSEALRLWRESFDRTATAWYEGRFDASVRAVIRQIGAYARAYSDFIDLSGRLQLGVGMELFQTDAWGSGEGSLHEKDLAEVLKWARRIRRDSHMRRLCQMIGRECSSDPRGFAERLSRAGSSVPDFTSREEIVGLELGRDLSRLVPGEISVLSDPDTSVLFDLRYVEGRLLCFSRQGWMSDEDGDSSEEADNGDSAGPMIICLDTSGSMRGRAETVAKAVTFYLTMRALAEKRRCYLISFSVDIATKELTSAGGMSQLAGFLRQSFDGGTDPGRAFSEAARVLGTGGYSRADVLMISDFDMYQEDLEMSRPIEEAKERGCRFFGLMMDKSNNSGNYYLRQLAASPIFDVRWRHVYRTGRTEEIE